MLGGLIDVFNLSMANHKAVSLFFYQVCFVVHRKLVESSIERCLFGYTRRCAITIHVHMEINKCNCCCRKLGYLWTVDMNKKIVF